jgi:predicted GIY-YIG superfamily endonuclease
MVRCTKVNFIQNLFSRHPAPKSAGGATYNWPGNSGKEYPYQICSLEAALKSLPGNFIYAKQVSEGDWSPIYIGVTRDLHQRLEGHVTVADAIAHGATHLHAHYCTTGQSARCAEERDLIQRWQPECNEPLAS